LGTVAVALSCDKDGNDAQLGRAGKPSYTLRLSHRDSDHFTIEGKLAGDQLQVELERYQKANTLLLTRGFHFINEVPFNR
jgi:hypothetical protein